MCVSTETLNVYKKNTYIQEQYAEDLHTKSDVKIAKEFMRNKANHTWSEEVSPTRRTTHTELDENHSRRSIIII